MKKFIGLKTDEDMERSAKQISDKKQDIKYDTRDYVIEYIVKKFEESEFFIPLSYQRQFIWTEKNCCSFIESVLMGLPIPFMFFADTDDGRIEIVDGAQRINTLVKFIQGNLRLNKLEVLTESNGFTFDDLSPTIQRRFKNTSLRVVFLEEGTAEYTRQEIFKRINTGGQKAKPAETRRGSYEGKFTEFLKACTENDKFNRLAPRTEQAERRYEGFELVSRFFAYSRNFNNGFKGYTGSVLRYIDKFVSEQNKLCETDEVALSTFKEKFDRMLDYASKMLGERGFRKTLGAKSTPHARFEALSVGISLALDECCELPVRDVSGWIDEEEFLKNTKSDAANNKSRLIKRISYVRDKLLKGI